MKTIAELEAASDAATEAYATADNRLGALDRLANLLSRLEDIDGLTSDDEGDIASLRARCVARRPALIAECDQLETAAIAAQHALNDAPEEAALSGAEKSAALRKIAARLDGTPEELVGIALLHVADKDLDNDACQAWGEYLTNEAARSAAERAAIKEAAAALIGVIK